MGFLWIFVLFINFNQIYAQKAVQLVNVTNKIIEGNVSFHIDWTSEGLYDIFSYSVMICVNKSLQVRIKTRCGQLAVLHDNTNFRNEYTAECSYPYYPSATYEVRVAHCTNVDGKKYKCNPDFQQCTKFENCKSPQTYFTHTAPLEPKINLKNMISCGETMCGVNVNITDIQISNSSLYVFQLKDDVPIMVDFVKNIRQMASVYEYSLNSSNPNINVLLNRTDNMCNNTIYLVAVNYYLEYLNYTTERMKQIDCTSNRTVLLRESIKNDSKPKGNKKLANNSNSNYYMYVIPIILIAIGIIAFIKRESLHEIYKKYGGNHQHESETTIPLVVTLPETSNKLKHPSRTITSESLNKDLVNNPGRILINLSKEFKNVPEDVSQKIYGESFQEKNRYKNVLPYQLYLTARVSFYTQKVG